MNVSGDKEACWSKLPVDLLKMIDEYMVLCVDKIRFRCVCSPWLSALAQLPNLRQSQQPPWLLLPYNSGSLCGLYHPFENKVYEVDLPEDGEKVFKGSDFGWVVTMLENGSIYVVNPLSRVRHKLPPRYKFPDVLSYRPDKRGHEYLFKSQYHMDRKNVSDYALDSAHVRNNLVDKIALSCCPSSGGDFSAVALYYGERPTLAYCKFGDNKWHDLLERDNQRRVYSDIIFCDGKLYALAHGVVVGNSGPSRGPSGRGELMVCKDIVSRPKLKSVVRGTTYADFWSEGIHLVDSSSHGLMAVFRMENGHRRGSANDEKYLYKTCDFRIYKVDMALKRWIQVQSLDTEMLFLGLGRQVGHSFPGSKGNQIYFATDNLPFNGQDEEDCFDDGIFNLDDKKFDPLGYVCNPQLIWPSPIWFEPNPS